MTKKRERRYVVHPVLTFSVGSVLPFASANIDLDSHFNDPVEQRRFAHLWAWLPVRPSARTLDELGLDHLSVAEIVDFDVMLTGDSLCQIKLRPMGRRSQQYVRLSLFGMLSAQGWWKMRRSRREVRDAARRAGDLSENLARASRVLVQAVLEEREHLLQLGSMACEGYLPFLDKLLDNTSKDGEAEEECLIRLEDYR